MKYLTKEELDHIALSLIENPSYETLRGLTDELKNKYSEVTIEINTNISPAPLVSEPVNFVANEPTLEPQPPVVELPKVEVSQMQNEVPINNITTPEVPSFAPLETPLPKEANNSFNNEPINFTGNLWEPEPNNLMSTTESFNNNQSNNPNYNIPVSNGQFFGNAKETVPNQIPIGGMAMPNNIPNPQGPSMFGQFEQNYNK